ncbi:MAG: hypothetical protein JSS69_18620 [Acidobacteria bacterium]|nr:hypothetical protein [Acidobacteriota bacterium]
MTRSKKKLGAFLIAALVLCAGGRFLLAQEKATGKPPQKDESRQPAVYEVLAKGVVGSAPFEVQFKSAALRLEIRNLVMGRGETEAIPTPTRIVLEVRQGAVTTTINQEKQARQQGDFWVVEKGSSFTIENPGEVAVLRAIYIFEGKS